MKRILLSLFCSLLFMCGKAQWVSIPDSNFGKWLKINFAAGTQGNAQTGFQIDTTNTIVLKVKTLNINGKGISNMEGIQYFKADSFLDCGINLFTTLSVFPPNLQKLFCSDNDSLTSIINLPASLNSIMCLRSRLSNLPSLPSSLVSLICNENQLTSLPPLPSSLLSLQCSKNKLTSLPALPPRLTYLNCSYNQLTDLPTLPDSLTGLNCSYNPKLSCIPNKLRSKMQSFNIDLTNIKCLPNRFGCLGSCGFDYLTMPLCDPTSGCAFYSNISGSIHQDTSINCSLDSLYPGTNLLNVKLQLLLNGQVIQQTCSHNFGGYSFQTPPNATYQVRLDTTLLPFDVTCPSNLLRSVTLTSSDTVEANLNFGLKCKGVDLKVQSIYGDRFRAAEYSVVKLLAGDMAKLLYNGSSCAKNTSGTVTLQFSGPIQYTSSMGTLSPAISGNTLTYTINDFSLLTENSFAILMKTDVHPAVGSNACFTATISTSANDIDLSNNSLTQCFVINNSLDPNAKEVYPTKISPYGNWLTYTVHFQNTGNDTAYDVVVRDTLSSSLDVESFQYLASSHNKYVIQLKGNEVVFNFPNINLVDSTTNPKGSEGWFQFKIMTKKNLPIGTVIQNRAAIYFDFNFAVYTNVASTSVVNGIEETAGINFNLYPNPNNGLFTIVTPESLNGSQLTITDMLGRVVKEQTINKLQESFQLNESQPGIYSATLTKENLKKVVRVVVY